MNLLTKKEAEQLNELNALATKGIITNDEYYEIAKEVLNDRAYYILINFGASAL